MYVTHIIPNYHKISLNMFFAVSKDSGLTFKHQWKEI